MASIHTPLRPVFFDIKVIKTAVFLALTLLPNCTWAKHKHQERWYQEQWCSTGGGQLEFLLPDQTRVDCLTDIHAVEHDFAPKWAEAIGQSLYYSAVTGKRAGVVLIMEQSSDQRYLERLRLAIEQNQLPVDVWTMQP